MALHFSLAIKKDEYIGNIIIPYIISNNENVNAYEIYKLIEINDLSKYEILKHNWIKQIVQNVEEYNILSLNNKYNKNKKLKPAVFLKNADKQIKQRVRNAVEIRLTNIIKLIKQEKPYLFYREDNSSLIYEEDFINISNNYADVEFDFERKENTLHYTLRLYYNNKQITLPNNKLLILTNQPATFVYNNNLIFFNEESKFNGNKLKPFLNKTEIVVEARLQDVFFEKFVKETVKYFNYNIKGFKLINKSVKITTELSIEKTINNKIVAIPVFNYNDKSIPFYIKQTTFVEVQKTNNNYELISFKRDNRYEISVYSILKKYGFEQKDNGFYIDNLDDKYSFIEFLTLIINELKQQGFSIKNRIFTNEICYDKPQIISKYTNKFDWFDLEIIVVFGKYEIPFKKLTKNILTKNKEYILPDGSIAIIPNEWFSELSYFAKNTNINNKTTLNKSNFAILENNKIVIPDANIQAKIAEFETNKPVKFPKNTVAKLRKYQKKGFEWIYSKTQNGFGICLADDMGLGKTLQTITVLQKFFENKDKAYKNVISKKEGVQLSLFDNPVTEIEKKVMNTALLIVPRSLIYNWQEELNKFAPELIYFVYYGNKRKEIYNEKIENSHIIITTYGVIRQDINILKKTEFSYIILDESHVIKNPLSKNYLAVTQLNSTYKIALTGTPIENSLVDLWSQMNFLNHNILGSLSYFKTEYIDKIGKDSTAIELEEVKQIVSPFILRRLKTDVAKELPEKSEQIIYCNLEPEQEKLYEEEKSAIRNELLSNKNKNNQYIKAIAVLNRLRQIVLHPKLINQEFEHDSGKFNTIINLIENLMAQGDKFLIFSSFVKNLNLYKQYFEDNNIEYSMLTGSDNNRQKIVEEYKNNSKIKPFLISIKAGGYGLNITQANYVLITDPWWNPLVEKQAIDRTHRIGQTKNVFVYKFITKSTIEEKILYMQKQKLDMSDALLNGETSNKITVSDIELLLE